MDAAQGLIGIFEPRYYYYYYEIYLEGGRPATWAGRPGRIGRDALAQSGTCS